MVSQSESMYVAILSAIARPEVWLAAPPFLPPGRGGLILIAGGLSMLAFALFLLSINQRPLPSGVTQAHGAYQKSSAGSSSRQRKTRPAAQQAAHWPEFVQRTAAAQGLGRPQVLSVQGTTCTMLVEDCPSCRRGRRNCKSEGKVLARAARRLSRRAEVREVSCNIDRRQACAFELRMRGRR